MIGSFECTIFISLQQNNDDNELKPCSTINVCPPVREYNTQRDESEKIIMRHVYVCGVIILLPLQHYTSVYHTLLKLSVVL